MKLFFSLFSMLVVVVMLWANHTVLAGYYRIKLNSGNEIVVKKYWDDGNSIRFYLDGGSVGIAKENIQTIVSVPDTVPPEHTGSRLITVPDNAGVEEEAREEPAAPDTDQKAANQQLELREKLDTVKTNIATLNERKINLQNQRAVAVDAKRQAEEQLEKARSTPFMPSEDRKQAEESGQRKMIEATERINNIDQALADVEALLGKQEALLKTLEERLP